MCFWIKLRSFFLFVQCVCDYIPELRIVLFGIWTWDFISDLFFCARMYEQKYYFQFIPCLIFVVFPWILNMIQLIRAEREWTRDGEIKHTIHRWLMKNNKKVIMLTGMCGSAYASVEMCNSRVFGMLI